MIRAAVARLKTNCFSYPVPVHRRIPRSSCFKRSGSVGTRHGIPLPAFYLRHKLPSSARSRDSSWKTVSVAHNGNEDQRGQDFSPTAQTSNMPFQLHQERMPAAWVSYFRCHTLRLADDDRSANGSIHYSLNKFPACILGRTSPVLAPCPTTTAARSSALKITACPPDLEVCQLRLRINRNSRAFPRPTPAGLVFIERQASHISARTMRLVFTAEGGEWGLALLSTVERLQGFNGVVDTHTSSRRILRTCLRSFRRRQHKSLLNRGYFYSVHIAVQALEARATFVLPLLKSP